MSEEQKIEVDDYAAEIAREMVSGMRKEVWESYKRKLIEACEEWCNDRRTKIVYGGLDKDALRLLEFVKTWEPGEK